jgi:hypothetical protein
VKKAFAIFFLSLFLFYTGGYYLVFVALKHQSNKKLAQLFDSGDYAEEETLTIKIPVTLPYPVYANGFERVNGEFEYKGEFFKLIKHKLDGDTLHIVCFKDVKAKSISTALADFAKLSNDIPLSSKSPISIIGKMIKDYEPLPQLDLTHQDTGWSRNAPFGNVQLLIPEITLPVFSPPPRQVC